MSKKSNKATLFTILFLASAFLGDKIISIDVGFLLSPYRVLLLFVPIVLVLYGCGNPFSVTNNNSPTYKYVVFLRFWLFYSLFLSLFCKDLSSFGYYFLFLLAAYFSTWFVFKYVNTKETFYHIFSLFEFIALFLSIIGIYEIITGDYRFIDDINLAYYDGFSAMDSALGIRVPISVFGNPNDYSLFLLFAVCVSNLMRHIRKSKIGRIMSTGLQVLFTAMIFTTLCRAAAISIIIVYGYLILSSFKSFSAIKKYLVILISVLAISYILRWVVANKDIVDAFLSVDINASSGSDYIRINLIRNGLIYLTNSLFFGVGIGNIEYHMLHHPIYNTENIINIHNWWLEVLVSSGIIIFLWYLKLYIKKLISSIKFVNHDKNKTELYYYNQSVVMMLLAFIIGSMSASSIFVTEWMWAMFAVIFAIPSKIE